MAIDVFIQTINGKKHGEVFDMNYSLAQLWPIGDPSFPLLQYIDPYGNAIFNGAQMPQIQKELQLLIEQPSSEEQRDVLRQVLNLAKECQEHPHKYLRFSGD
jgi:hypothetical protein